MNIDFGSVDMMTVQETRDDLKHKLEVTEKDLARVAANLCRLRVLYFQKLPEGFDMEFTHSIDDLLSISAKLKG